jgi:phosphatidylinositol alpha-mannosyltransferase
VTRRVAIVSPYALSVFGGVQEQVLAMSRELSRRGDAVVVVAPDVHDHAPLDTPARVERFGRLLSLPANGSRAPLTLSPFAARRAYDAVRSFRPDVVHFHEPFAPLVGWATLRAHDTAAVATFHRSGDGPALRLTGPLLRTLATRLDASVAVSTQAASTIRSAAGIAAHVLFNGFEVERFVEHPRERASEVVLVTVGRLEERKGTSSAIRAVRAHNARSSRHWLLVVIGDGPQRAALDVLADHDPSIVFLDALGDEQKRSWLRRANVVIAPATRGESFGLVLLEAMASEASVVASDIDGYRDAAGGHALLFAPGDANDLERAVEAALAEETPERIAAARAHAEYWSMRRLMDEYELVYQAAHEHFDSNK